MSKIPATTAVETSLKKYEVLKAIKFNGKFYYPGKDGKPNTLEVAELPASLLTRGFVKEVKSK